MITEQTMKSELLQYIQRNIPSNILQSASRFRSGADPDRGSNAFRSKIKDPSVTEGYVYCSIQLDIPNYYYGSRPYNTYLSVEVRGMILDGEWIGGSSIEVELFNSERSWPKKYIFGTPVSKMLYRSRGMKVFDPNKLPLFDSIESVMPSSEFQDIVDEWYNSMYINVLEEFKRNDIGDVEQYLIDNSSDTVYTYRIITDMSNEPESFEYRYAEHTDYIEFEATGDLIALLGFRLVMSDDSENILVDVDYLLDEWDVDYLKDILRKYPTISALKRSSVLRDWRFGDPYTSVIALINMTTGKKIFGK